MNSAVGRFANHQENSGHSQLGSCLLSCSQLQQDSPQADPHPEKNHLNQATCNQANHSFKIFFTIRPTSRLHSHLDNPQASPSQNLPASSAASPPVNCLVGPVHSHVPNRLCSRLHSHLVIPPTNHHRNPSPRYLNEPPKQTFSEHCPLSSRQPPHVPPPPPPSQTSDQTQT